MHAVSNWTATLNGKSLGPRWACSGQESRHSAPLGTNKTRASESASWGFPAPGAGDRVHSPVQPLDTAGSAGGLHLGRQCLSVDQVGGQFQIRGRPGLRLLGSTTSHALCQNHSWQLWYEACAGCIETYSELSLESEPINMELSHPEGGYELHKTFVDSASRFPLQRHVHVLSGGCDVLSPCSSPIRTRSYPKPKATLDPANTFPMPSETAH